MTYAFWSFLILAVLGILAIVSAFVPAVRLFASCCGCCALAFNLVVIIVVTYVRFNEAGRFCAAPGVSRDYSTMKTEFVIEDGLFLKRVVITMWVLLIFNCCCLLAPARLRESSSGSGMTELATAQPRD